MIEVFKTNVTQADLAERLRAELNHHLPTAKITFDLEDWTLGKASVTGYCIKFKTLKDIDIDVLEKAILDGVGQTKN